MRFTNIQALILSSGITLSGFFIAYALQDSRSYRRHVQVKGLSERIVKADQAIWSIQFRYASDELSQLYQGVAKAQSDIKNFLLDLNIDSKEISVNPISVSDNQNNSYNSNQLAKRFSANGGITIATSDVNKISSSIQKTGDLVKDGVIVTSSNVQYRFTSLNQIKPEMLNEATVNAKKSAMSFAVNANAKLGSIQSARQGIFSINDANSEYNSGATIMKKVRIVTTISFYLH